MGTTVSSDDLKQGIETLGLQGKIVCLHSSLRSFGSHGLEARGNVSAAEMVIEAFLAAGCTLVVPTFTRWFEVMPPPAGRYERNGLHADDERIYEYYQIVLNQWDLQCYTPTLVLMSMKDMGILPATLVRMDGRARGDHPLISFTAVGAQAASVISHQSLQHPYRLFDVVDVVLLMGTPLRRMSLLHYAEQRAGRNLFRRWVNTCAGAVVDVPIGGCSEGFDKLEAALAPHGQEVFIGTSRWRAFPTQAALRAAADAVRANPTITHCGDSKCARCNDAVQGGPVM